VDFDHHKSVVRCSKKLNDKLQRPLGGKVTVDELHARVSRLIYGAGVLRIPLATFYLVCKFLRRCLNKKSRRLVSGQDEVEIPPGCEATRILAARSPHDGM
jgi:hypothetical protein